MEHKIRYGGGKKAGWTWECSCGESEGVDDIPYADAFDRTYWAKKHLDEVRAALAVVRNEEDSFYEGGDVTVHTYPVGDLIEHDVDGGDCICEPTIESVFREDGSNGWHVIHHSLDGREQKEER